MYSSRWWYPWGLIFFNCLICSWIWNLRRQEKNLGLWLMLSKVKVWVVLKLMPKSWLLNLPFPSWHHLDDVIHLSVMCKENIGIFSVCHTDKPSLNTVELYHIHNALSKFRSVPLQKRRELEKTRKGHRSPLNTLLPHGQQFMCLKKISKWKSTCPGQEWV